MRVAAVAVSARPTDIQQPCARPPAIRADRCYEFGKTLARLLKDDPRRDLDITRQIGLAPQQESIFEALTASVQVGRIYDGVVTSVKDFGAFVDLDGADGLIPVSEMSWKPRRKMIVRKVSGAGGAGGT